MRKDAKGFLLPGNIYGNVKVLGFVTAGWPSPAEEELLDTITIDEFLIENRVVYPSRVDGLGATTVINSSLIEQM